MKKIGVYRQQLFLLSETFIYNQMRAIEEFNPIALGSQMNGSPSAGINYFLPEGYSSRFFQYKRRLLFNPKPFTNYVKENEIQLIHSHFGLDSLDAVKIKSVVDIPLVATYHGFDATRTKSALLKSLKPSYIRYGLFEKEVKHNADLIICVSDFIKEKLVERGYPENKLVRHYIGIPFPSQESQNSEETTVGEKKVILHVARLTEKKGTEYLIRAFKNQDLSSQNLELVIIGEGELLKNLKRLTFELKIADRVKFLGGRPHSEVLSMMQKAYLFCVPSVTASDGDAEGLGMVFLESQSFGVPVVSTLHGGIPEAVKDGETGFLCEEKSVDKLSQGIDALVKDENLRDKMGKAGHAFVRKNFDINNQTKELESIYRRLL